MNATWGLFPPLPEAGRRRDKRERARAHLARARLSFTAFAEDRSILRAGPAPDEPVETIAAGGDPAPAASAAGASGA